MKKHFVLLFLVYSFIDISAQTRFSSLSRAEKKWALLHPFTARKIKKYISVTHTVVESVKKENLLDQYENGGKLDAFRHIFTMAFLAQRISRNKLRSLGIAHEKGNREQFEKDMMEHGEAADSISCVMDLRNNEIGFEIGKKFRQLNADSLKHVIIHEIKSGNAWEIYRNEKGNYLQCNGTEINLLDWKGKWDIPKCLNKTG